MLDIVPKPHFVIKTKILSDYQSFSAGAKLFVNVCSHEEIPSPPPVSPMHSTSESENFQPELVFPLIMENKWEIPIWTSPHLRGEKDKSGKDSLAIDCIISPKSLKWIVLNSDLKSILIEWCFESIEFQFMDADLLIDRNSISFPKMSYKGKDVQEAHINPASFDGGRRELAKLENNETVALLEAKRAFDEPNELPDISTFISGDKGSRKPLIEEIEEMKISPVVKSELEPVREKIQFETQFSKASHPFKILVKIKSELSSAADYDLGYDPEEKNLVVKAAKSEESQMTLPLPLDVTGEFKCYYVTSTNQLCVYVG